MTRKIVPERPAPHPYPLTAAQTRDVFYGYDLRGLQTFARFDSQSGDGVTNGHDGFGRLVSHGINMGGVTRTLAYQYDRGGSRTRITHPDGAFFSTTYDGLSRPTWMHDPAGSGVAVTHYSAAGTPNAVGRPGASSGLWITGDGRLISLSHYLAAGLEVYWTFTHNPARQIAGATRSNDDYAWGGHYAVNRNYVTDGLNRYSQAGSAAFAYDGNGNLTGDGARTYSYDVENRLVAASGPSVALRYDPLGRLYEMIGPSGTTQFLYDGDALAGEYLNTPHTMTRRYVHGANAGADDPLIWYDPTVLHYLHTDHQGSIVAAANNAGTVVAINAYDEYGIPNAANQGRFQYTGQIWLPELGMYHYKARMYSPTLGRFPQTDPVGYDDQFNLYAYVGNDPVNKVDSSGAWSAEVHSIIFAAALRNRITNYWPLWLANNVSIEQDVGSGANDYHAHFLRSPGENPNQARAAFNRYVDRQVQEARAALRRGDEAGAVRGFARAAHARMDSHSPVHNKDGLPAEYRDRPFVPSVVDALLQNHSPTDSVGGEGTNDLTEVTRSRMVRETRELANRIWGPPTTLCTGSRIRRESC